MPTGSDVLIKLLRLRSATDAAEVQSKLKRLLDAVKFDANQPRVPAGNPDGGQWTSGAGATSAVPALENADDPESIIEFAQRLILAGSSLTYQRCLTICSRLLERPITPRWSDINKYDFHRCMAACMAGQR